jgi:hypothetical protein
LRAFTISLVRRKSRNRNFAKTEETKSGNYTNDTNASEATVLPQGGIIPPNEWYVK